MTSKQMASFREQLNNHEFAAIIDLEATCYDNWEEKQGNLSEVIEVGWALYHLKAGEIIDKRSFLIKPTTSFISPFCTELTGITPEQVFNAPTFVDTMRELHSFHKDQNIRLWLSQGNYDRRKLVSQCELEGVPYPFEDHEWINIKTIARHALNRKNRLGLKSLLHDLKLPLIGRHHSGMDDAYNSARVLHQLLNLSKAPSRD